MQGIKAWEWMNECTPIQNSLESRTNNFKVERAGLYDSPSSDDASVCLSDLVQVAAYRSFVLDS